MGLGGGSTEHLLSCRASMKNYAAMAKSKERKKERIKGNAIYSPNHLTYNVLRLILLCFCIPSEDKGSNSDDFFLDCVIRRLVC